MNRRLLLIALPALAAFAFPAQDIAYASSGLHHGFSATRLPGEHASRYLLDLYFALPPEHVDETVAGKAVRFESLDYSRVPILGSKSQVDSLFRAARDARSWEWADMSGFARRITWLYPQDGCYLRARQMADTWSARAGVLPAQAFVFGDMQLSTPYGDVVWWYHVAPAFSDGREVYVLDPSLDSSQPMRIKEWAAKATDGRIADATFAICSSSATWPEADCDQESGQDKETIDSWIQDFLANEWENLQDRGMDPSRLLGDAPPWAAAAPALTAQTRNGPSRGSELGPNQRAIAD